MPLVGKIPMRRLNAINDALEYMSKKIADIADADKIHIIYKSYLEYSLTGHERLRKSAKLEPI